MTCRTAQGAVDAIRQFTTVQATIWEPKQFTH